MPEILVLADDLTGALEAGAGFAQNGLSTVVSLQDSEDVNASVLVFDTQTRHISAEAAKARVAQLASLYPARLIYKKTDSTLRGNIRAELTALAEQGPVLYVPAYPKMGRTVINGCLHVHGVPLHETEFAGDLLNPISDSHIGRLLQHHPNIAISEASTDAEISEVARQWMLRGGIAAGPAALAHQAAALLKPQVSYLPNFPSVHRALVVTGSRHPRSRQQIARAETHIIEAGWEVICSPEQPTGDPLRFAEKFGTQIAKQVRGDKFDTLIVFGGDTARAILQALEIVTLIPVGEIRPGVPVSLLPNRITFITKAGGFGSEDLLLEMLQ